MCTVTYVAKKDGFTLTSSRDESLIRPTEDLKEYTINSQKITFPKDSISGGTWIALSQKKRLLCLLNGAYKPHKKATYQKSRGKVVMENFSHKSPQEFISQVDLSAVEPFTLLQIDYNKELEFHEFIWDGENLACNKKSTENPQIWMSATLYDSETKIERKKWFEDWVQLEENRKVSDFHHYVKQKEEENSKMLDVGRKLQTVSISSVVVENGESEFEYQDFVKDTKTVKKY